MIDQVKKDFQNLDKNDVVYHIADDGTMVEKKDWDWLQKHMKKQRSARKTQTSKRRTRVKR